MTCTAVVEIAELAAIVVVMAAMFWYLARSDR